MRLRRGQKTVEIKGNYQPDPRTLLDREVEVEVDRPLGSVHPRHAELVYPVNYGFVPNTLAPDGREIDAYILGVDEALESFTGRCLALLHRTNDDDDKLVVVPEGLLLTDEEILSATHFQEQYFDVRLIR